MHRLFKAGAIISAAVALLLVNIWVLSFELKSDSMRPGFAVTPRFHVGVSAGAFYSYSHVLFTGGTFDILGPGETPAERETILPFPGGHYIAVHFPRQETVWAFRITLLYPILLFSVPTLVWMFQTRQPWRSAEDKPGPLELARSPVSAGWTPKAGGSV